MSGAASEFIGKQVQVTLDDARVVYGKVECLDSDRNLILGNTVQRPKAADQEPVLLGYVMLPGSHIVKVEM